MRRLWRGGWPPISLLSWPHLLRDGPSEAVCLLGCTQFAAGVFLPTLYCVTITALLLCGYHRDISYLISALSVGFTFAMLMACGCYRHRRKYRLLEKRRLLKLLASFDFDSRPTSEAAGLLKAVFTCFDVDESGDLSRRELIDAIHAIHRDLTPEMIRAEMARCPQIKSSKITQAEFVEVIDDWNEHFRNAKNGLLSAALTKDDSVDSSRRSALSWTRAFGRPSNERRSNSSRTSSARSLEREDTDSFSKLRFRRAMNKMKFANCGHAAPSAASRVVSLLRLRPKPRSIAPASHAVMIACSAGRQRADAKVLGTGTDAGSRPASTNSSGMQQLQGQNTPEWPSAGATGQACTGGKAPPSQAIIPSRQKSPLGKSPLSVRWDHSAALTNSTTAAASSSTDELGK